MKSYNLLLIIILSVFSITLSNEQITIDLITTNDVHGSLVEQSANFMNPQYPPTILGAAGLFEYCTKYIDNEKVLIFDAGNFFQGHPISQADSGRTVIEFMNKMNYTALVPGVDDFIYGSKNLNNLAEISDFPFIITNITCNDCDLKSNNFKSYHIKTIDSLTIGILGIVNTQLSDQLLSKNIKGVSVNGVKETLDIWVPKINELADIVIILTSAGIPWDREIVYNNFIKNIKEDIANNITNDFKHLNAVEMGYFSKNVDFIISGGFSKGYPIPWEDPNTNVHIMQNYGNGSSFGHLKLNFIDNKYIGYDFAVKNNQSQTLLSDDFIPDKIIQKWLNEKNDNAMEKLYKNFSHDSISYSNNEIISHDKKLDDNWPFPKLGNDEKLDILTWNCEFFPIANDSTIEALSEAITDFDVDVIAFQEIKKTGWFGKLMERIPNYDFIISQNSSFMNQAVIFKKNQFKFIRTVEPFSDNDYNFAGRPPLRVDLYRYSDSTYYSIIDIHMKCCDSGLNRRKLASKMLHKYIDDDINNGYSNFIILGDWNDDLKDDDGEHCFDPFLNDERFYFVTDVIVDDILQASYPKEPYVSFLDHILVTKTLLNINSSFHIETIKMGEYMHDYKTYEKLISDHLPVLLSF